MHVDAAKTRCVEDGSTQDQAVGSHHEQVEVGQQVLVAFQALRRVDFDSSLLGAYVDGAGACLATATGRSLWLCEHTYDLVAGVEEPGQHPIGKFGRAGKSYAHARPACVS